MKVLVISLMVLALAATCESIAQCPQAKACYDDLTTAKTSHNVSVVCSSLGKGGKCLDALNNACPDVKKALNLANIEIDDAQLMDCSGKCGAAAEVCLSPVVDAIKGATQYTMDLCKTITTAFTCVENIPAATCAARTKTALKAVAQNEKDQYFSDYCDDKGQPSACFAGINKCYQVLQTVKAGTTAKVACKTVETYLQCESDTKCKDSLKAFKTQIRNKLESTESQSKCPTVGSCDERVTKCATDTQAKLNALGANPTDKDTKAVCNDITTTNKCFDAVRKDPICDIDAFALSTSEKQLKKVQNDQCGASSIIVSTGLILFGVLMSMFKSH